MTLSFPSPAFDDAVAAVCHGSATEAEMSALNVLLRSDPRARDEYLLRIELHSRLASEPDLFPQAVDPAAVCPLPAIRDVSQGTWRGPRAPVPIVRGTRRTLGQVVALAACLVLAAVGVWNFGFRQPAVRRNAASTAVAVLTRAVDARWTQSTDAPRLGRALEPGWLRLESGLAQIVFYSGARVVVEGPAALHLVSPTEAACRTGRLLVEVPQPARGFRLKTEQLEVVDLGTAFGIDATAERTEVHVFKGKVELLSSPGAREPLDEGQAAVVRGSAPPQRMAASPAAFASLRELQRRSLASEAIRYDLWQLTGARRNQDPSLVVRLGFDDLSGVDWTLRNAAEGNHAVPDATIVGCRRAEGRWREKPALDFQGLHDRVRLVVPGDFGALTLSTWVSVKGLERQFNSLFMCDGFEPGTIHWLIRHDGVLGLTVIGPGSGQFQILRSPPVVTPDQFGLWLHLAVVLDGTAGQVVHYVNGSPVARHALEVAPPFRIGPAELGNWNARTGADPAPFLIRHLSGSLDEFELFGRALSDEEIRELYADGTPDG